MLLLLLLVYRMKISMTTFRCCCCCWSREWKFDDDIDDDDERERERELTSSSLVDLLNLVLWGTKKNEWLTEMIDEREREISLMCFVIQHWKLSGLQYTHKTFLSNPESINDKSRSVDERKCLQQLVVIVWVRVCHTSTTVRALANNSLLWGHRDNVLPDLCSDPWNFVNVDTVLLVLHNLVLNFDPACSNSCESSKCGRWMRRYRSNSEISNKRWRAESTPDKAEIERPWKSLGSKKMTDVTNWELLLNPDPETRVCVGSIDSLMNHDF